MTIHRYLLEYLLENVFQGNQSSCAKELGMSYNDFRKFRKRMAEGSFSSRIAESILTFCWRDGIEMKDFFEKYSQSRLGEDIEERENACKDFCATVESVIQVECRKSNNLAELMHSAEDFADKIRRYVCEEDVCMRHVEDEEACPVCKLNHLIDQLKVQCRNHDAP